jgi:hypothetical protein
MCDAAFWANASIYVFDSAHEAGAPPNAEHRDPGPKVEVFIAS